jgi:pyridoxamine 5'-phosphate oxidase
MLGEPIGSVIFHGNEEDKMNRQDCIQFANEHPVCFLATMDGDQPRVRTVLLVKADETGFYFDLLNTKNVVKQVQANPKVEVCFYNNASDLMAARQMRMTGVMELVKDETLIQKVAADRSFLDGLAGRPTAPLTMVYKLSQGKAFFWTMPDILKEASLERVEFA